MMDHKKWGLAAIGIGIAFAIADAPFRFFMAYLAYFVDDESAEAISFLFQLASGVLGAIAFWKLYQEDHSAKAWSLTAAGCAVVGAVFLAQDWGSLLYYNPLLEAVAFVAGSVLAHKWAKSSTHDHDGGVDDEAP